MFPIDIFQFKANRFKNFRNSFRDDLLPPVGADKYQYEIKANPNYHSILKDNIFIFGKELSENITNSNTFCYYCGTETSNVIPAFMHNGSGINLWMYSDWRCASIICEKCNVNSGKENVSYLKQFKEISASTPMQILKFEPDVLLPTLEPVHLHFSYPNSGILKPLTTRAEKTIERFSLNRPELVRRRLSVIKEFQSKQLDGDLYSITTLSSPIDILFCMEIDKNTDDHFDEYDDYYYKYLNRKSKLYIGPENKHAFTQQPYKKITYKPLDDNKIRRKGYPYTNFSGLGYIELSGIRGFDNHQSIRFDGKKSIIIIGENGVGKSTLLELVKRAIKPKSKLSLRDLVNKEDLTPYFKVEYNHINEFFSYYECGSKTGEKSPCNLIEISESRVSSTSINSFITWVNDYSHDHELMDWVARKLKILLDIGQSNYFETYDKNICWVPDDNPDDRVYFEHYSSGYRSIINIFHSIISKLTIKDNNKIDYNLSIINDSLSSTIVLIDEIELHLHPKFKKEIVKKLQETFPEVLFIMTTHDPLVLKSANSQTKVLLLEKINGKTTIRSELPSHENLTTEQILTSPIFGLSTTSSDKKQFKIDCYNKAIDDENWELANSLREELNDVGYFGKTYRELLALSAVDAYLKQGITPSIEQIIAELKIMEDDDA